MVAKQKVNSFGGCMSGSGKIRNSDNITDALLASELNDLSVKERERVYEDIHGVAPITEETSELLQEAFAKLTDALATVSRGRRRAYDRAVFLKPSLEKDTKFKMMFLRADQYDAAKAAQRMCKYFANKLELFGQEKLVKKITLDDLNEDDIAAVNTGSVQILPRKDSAGRVVWFIAHRYKQYKYWHNQIRYIWHTLMGALEDEDAQLNGLVNVVYCNGTDKTELNFSQMATQGGPLLMGLPFRIAGIHFCYNDARLRPALSLIQMVVGKHYRLRFRTHFGSHVESQYALMTFGIPMGCIPIRSDGSLKVEATERYLAQRRYKEEEWQKENENDGTILYPSSKDVLLGRGRPFQEFPGNQMLLQLIKFHRAQYQQATNRFEKTCLSLDLAKCMQERGGRFLQRIPQEGWEEVDDATARAKISHSFRAKPLGERKKAAESPSYDATSSSNKRLRYDEGGSL